MSLLTRVVGVVHNIFRKGNPNGPADSSLIIATPVLQATVAAVHAASTGNVDLANPGSTMDDVTLIVGEDYLLWQQSDDKENFIYTFDGTQMVRSSLYETLAHYNKLVRCNVQVGGTSFGGHEFIFNNVSPVFGTDSLSWTDVSATAQGLSEATIISYTTAAGVTVNIGEVVTYPTSAVVLARGGSSDADIYLPLGVAKTAGSNGQAIQVVRDGLLTFSSAVFSAGDVGKNLWLSTTTAGAMTAVAPTSNGDYRVLVGRIESVNSMYVLCSTQEWTKIGD